jgi:hypothetical protein
LIHLGPLILHRKDPDAATLAFAVGLLVPLSAAPRVALRARPARGVALPKNAGVEVVGVVEGERVELAGTTLRFMIFEAEAIRGDVPYQTAVIAELGPQLLEGDGPLVAPRGA